MIEGTEMHSLHKNRMMYEPNAAGRSPKRKMKRPKTTQRLYMAPPSSIRTADSSGRGGDAVVSGSRSEDKTGGELRRRPERRDTISSPNGISRVYRRPSNDGMLETLRPPMVFDKEEKEGQLLSNSLHDSFGDLSVSRAAPRKPLRKSMITIDHGGDHSEYDGFDEELFASNNVSHDERKKTLKVRLRALVTGSNLFQFSLLLMLGWLVFDSHHKQKVKLRQYDEERSHIMENMVWIDKRAKQAHSKTMQKTLLADFSKESKEELQVEASQLQEEVERLQKFVRLNAREWIEHRFGENPAEVSLSLDPDGAEHIVIALTDDTPHAVAILVKQVDRNIWDDVGFQRLASGSVQGSPRLSGTTPLLEFVEKSRRCHDVGAVAVHQLEIEDRYMLVLRIHLQANMPIDEGDVCVGRVIEGLDLLEQHLEDLPVLQDVNAPITIEDATPLDHLPP